MKYRLRMKRDTSRHDMWGSAYFSTVEELVKWIQQNKKALKIVEKGLKKDA